MTSAEKVVLLVEDNSNDEMLALRALKKVDIQIRVDVARDGIEATNYLLDAAMPCPDLVLLDLRLPRMNGLEVLNSIRSNPKTRNLPVVVFTSSSQPSDVMNCFQSGANSFVRKSHDYAQYMILMSKIVDYWLTVNEPCIPAVSAASAA
jgi:two-component system response regulator